MERIDIQSIQIIGLERVGQEFVKHIKFPLTFACDRNVKLGNGVLALAIVNETVVGALTTRAQVSDKDLPAQIYVLYTATGQIYVEAELALAALSEAGVGATRNRTVRMNDADHQYLSNLGGGNVSEGIREAVRKTKLAEAQIFQSSL